MHDRILSNVSRDTRNGKAATWWQRPLPSTALVLSEPLPTSLSVAKMQSHVRHTAFTAPYLHAHWLSDKACRCSGCLPGCSSFCLAESRMGFRGWQTHRAAQVDRKIPWQTEPPLHNLLKPSSMCEHISVYSMQCKLSEAQLNSWIPTTHYRGPIVTLWHDALWVQLTLSECIHKVCCQTFSCETCCLYVS